ncbi:hypothetical protein D4764_16G0006720 [Takifugu flavidus]|uniref:Uncharacterized protein n=1 Tax=Takifugu flavidus TaxID=433684 RepID=A0A5C6NYR3_9TELE|nr:hypothetical protein D4764_16G0006720 [Takifugu flavidus]
MAGEKEEEEEEEEVVVEEAGWAQAEGLVFACGLSYLGPQTGWHTSSVLNNAASGPDGLDLMRKVPDTVAEGAWQRGARKLLSFLLRISLRMELPSVQTYGSEQQAHPRVCQVGRESCSCQSPAGPLLSRAVPPEPRHPNVPPSRANLSYDPPIWMDGCHERAPITLGKSSDHWGTHLGPDTPLETPLSLPLLGTHP